MRKGILAKIGGSLLDFHRLGQVRGWGFFVQDLQNVQLAGCPEWAAKPPYRRVLRSKRLEAKLVQ
jgi:hypothetical protein